MESPVVLREFLAIIPIFRQMDSESERKRRAGIAYILRRRKRGRKAGANTGEVVKSWAEYSEVNYTPKGAYSTKWRWLMIAAWLGSVSIPVVFFVVAGSAFSSHSEDLGHPRLHPIGWVLLAVACVLVLAVGLFAIVYIFVTLRRIVRASLPYKNE